MSLNLLIDTPRQGSFYLKRALLAPVCQSPAVASFPSLPPWHTRSLLAMTSANYGCFGSCCRALGWVGVCAYFGCGVRRKLSVVPVVPVWCIFCGCGCGWVVWVLNPAPGGMVTRGVGNLYTWRSRHRVRESMICRYDGTAHRKKVSGEENWGAERRLISPAVTTTGFGADRRDEIILCAPPGRRKTNCWVAHRHIENILYSSKKYHIRTTTYTIYHITPTSPIPLTQPR